MCIQLMFVDLRNILLDFCNRHLLYVPPSLLSCFWTEAKIGWFFVFYNVGYATAMPCKELIRKWMF